MGENLGFMGAWNEAVAADRNTASVSHEFGHDYDLKVIKRKLQTNRFGETNLNLTVEATDSEGRRVKVKNVLVDTGSSGTDNWLIGNADRQNRDTLRQEQGNLIRDIFRHPGNYTDADIAQAIEAVGRQNRAEASNQHHGLVAKLWNAVFK